MITVLVTLPIRLDQREKFATDVVPTIMSRKPDGNTSLECLRASATPATSCRWSRGSPSRRWTRGSGRRLSRPRSPAVQNFLAGPPAVSQFSGSMQPATV
jgi:hypothetical protein